MASHAIYRDLRENPGTILKSMPEKLFMVYLSGAEDQMDLAYHQPVRASRVEVSEGCLSFFKADGTLAAYFDKSAVRSWREINESELLANWVGWTCPIIRLTRSETSWHPVLVPDGKLTKVSPQLEHKT